MKKLSLVLMLFTFIGGIIAAESRYYQVPDVKTLYEQVRLLTIKLHQHSYDDYAIRISFLEGIESPTQSERRLLSYYKSQKEKVSILLEGMSE